MTNKSFQLGWELFVRKSVADRKFQNFEFCFVNVMKYFSHKTVILIIMELKPFCMCLLMKSLTVNTHIKPKQYFNFRNI